MIRGSLTFQSFFALAFCGFLYQAGPASAQATDLVCNQCVGTSDIASGAVTGAKLAANAVNNSKIANGSVNAAKLAANAANVSKLANSAVSTGKLTTAAVTSAKLAPNAVKTSKIANAAVTSAKIAAGAVNRFKLADGAVTLEKLNRVNLIWIDAAGPTAADNCASLLAALAGISGNSASNRFVIQLGPGVYDCGTTRVVMKSFVDLAGSGMMTTHIVGQMDDSALGVLGVVSDMELRDLSVTNQSLFNDFGNVGVDAINAMGTRLTRVRADGGTLAGPFNCGMLIAGISNSNVTIVGSVLKGLVDGVFVDNSDVGNMIQTQIISENSPFFPTGGNGTANCVKSYEKFFGELLPTCESLI